MENIKDNLQIISLLLKYVNPIKLIKANIYNVILVIIE